jgi:hypothetical protein
MEMKSFSLRRSPGPGMGSTAETVKWYRKAADQGQGESRKLIWENLDDD